MIAVPAFLLLAASARLVRQSRIASRRQSGTIGTNDAPFAAFGAFLFFATFLQRILGSLSWRRNRRTAHGMVCSFCPETSRERSATEGSGSGTPSGKRHAAGDQDGIRNFPKCLR